MPLRRQVLATGEIYHVFNRGIDRRVTFVSKQDKSKILECWWFYRYHQLPLKLSLLDKLKSIQKVSVYNTIAESQQRVEILAYCIMPNHFHLLVKQTQDKGISRFIADSTISYTRWFNIHSQRSGALFSTQFKAVRIESDEQLLQVSRYIHLNPYTNFLVKTHDEVLDYPWSSIKAYLGQKDLLISKSQVKQLIPSPDIYRKLVIDQADYQRQLDYIKHLTLDG